MSQEILSANFNDTGEPVRVGDKAWLDASPVVVKGVYQPGTREAEGFSCEDSGGLLLLHDDGCLCLIPMGHYHRITKREEPSEGSAIKPSGPSFEN